MSLNLDSKKAVVAEVAKALGSAQTIAVAKYHGVTVEGLTTIRVTARKEGVYLHVLKNTLARKAMEGTKFSPLADQLVGPLIYGISEDPVAAAKVINEFVKANGKAEIVAGMYNDKLLNVDEVKVLAATPSRDELLAQIMGVMQQIPASFVRLVAAIKDKKEQEAA